MWNVTVRGNLEYEAIPNLAASEGDRMPHHIYAKNSAEFLEDSLLIYY